MSAQPLEQGEFLLQRAFYGRRLFYPRSAAERHVPYNVGRNKAKRAKRALFGVRK